jgi:hypothetical protein
VGCASRRWRRELTERFIERDARFSPDGRWIADVSEETGTPEVSVQTIAEPRRRDVISVGGGSQPVWGRDGKELFFVDLQGNLRSARVERAADGRLVFGHPVAINVPPIGTGHFGTQYNVSADGQRIYFLDRRIEPAPVEFGVFVGRRSLLK